MNPTTTRRIAFACFKCRVSFKRTVSFERTEESDQVVCPNCGGTLCRMGWSFHAPPKADAEQWTKVQVLYAEGFRFEGSGGRGAESLPARLRDVATFVADNGNHVLRTASRQPELLP
jgi:DNA-directed RNA polymerase subunit RPC12/RpoP